MKKILILDANNACWRIIKVVPVLTANGKPIQVVYAFLRLLRSCIEQFEPDVALVCWDSGRSAYRKKIYPNYKSNRTHDKDKEHEEEYKSFLMQANTLKTVLSHLNVKQAEYPDSEADDLIGVACSTLEGKKIIVSSDMDMLQLVNQDTQVWSPIKGELYRIETFKKKMGLSPEAYLEMRALIGDTTDNIPGVAKGFGEATARELLDKYGGLDKLFSPIVEKRVSNKGNRYALLYSEGAKETAFRNLILMDLKVAAVHCGSEVVKMVLQHVKARSKVDRAKVKLYFQEQKFVSLLSDFGRWITAFESLDSE
jgi:DNA polymerase-1